MQPHMQACGGWSRDAQITIHRLSLLSRTRGGQSESPLTHDGLQQQSHCLLCTTTVQPSLQWTAAEHCNTRCRRLTTRRLRRSRGFVSATRPSPREPTRTAAATTTTGLPVDSVRTLISLASTSFSMRRRSADQPNPPTIVSAADQLPPPHLQPAQPLKATVAAVGDAARAFRNSWATPMLLCKMLDNAGY